MGEGDVPAGPGLVFAVFVVLGVAGGDGLGDKPVDDDGTAGTTVGDLFVDPDRSNHRGGGGSGGRRGGPARPAPPTVNPFPQQGEAVAQVEGVGDQLCPGRRGHAQRQRERFGVNAATTVPVTAQRLIREEGGSTEGLDASVLVAG